MIAQALVPDGMQERGPDGVQGCDAVLFDLDGTLVDPAGGISGGIAHALKQMGLPIPGESVLAAMVGPKLSDALLDLTDAAAAQVPELIRIYRRWYALEGIAMGQVYPGVREVLGDLQERGVALGVATQKPQALAGTVLRAHGLAGYFSAVFGSANDEAQRPSDPGYRSGKKEIIASAAQALAGSRRPIMVGDRAQDVRGALANGLDCIGVTWGFALGGELETAGAAIVVGDAPALLAELNRRLTGISR
ncbi:HAD hydrolase-like protein [Arthrobacter sp. H14-L1]|uniref:HAD hydrolase-like protein n=1 Tax=Arthrobacter sp. H14-L1 TaxID=2996697 RepID=UPI002270FD4C|nr:HAD hydrolase-like protein [Arthrobacter sp. H14-L1]MCY0905250.1 HAD hydrolase-like protein [Arthrobacter sp. H14-L1]